MKKWLLGLLFLFCGSVQAAPPVVVNVTQNPQTNVRSGGNGHGWGGGYGWGHYHHASTAAEGYLTGLGQLYRGQGFYLTSLGRYYIYREQARKLYIENWKLYVHSAWEIRDENKARFKRDNPDYLTRETQKLEVLERKAALNARKKELVESGILAPLNPTITYKGKKYKSMEELRNSPDYK